MVMPPWANTGAAAASRTADIVKKRRMSWELFGVNVHSTRGSGRWNIKGMPPW